MTKEYTEADLKPWAGGVGISVDDPRMDLLDVPLWWHKQHLSQTASGYGGKLTTRWKINFCGKWYRVYATCYSNSASHWFVARGRKISIY